MTKDEIVKAENSLPTFENRVLTVLNAKTPKDKIKTRPGRGGKSFSYVETGYVIKQLDKAFNHLWEWEIVEEKVGETQVWVKGRLTAWLAPGFSIKKEAYGGSDIKKSNDLVIDIGDDLKSASSDALKKSASMLGIASDVYFPNEVAKIPEAECTVDHEKLPILFVASGDNKGKQYRICGTCTYFRWMDKEGLADPKESEKK